MLNSYFLLFCLFNSHQISHCLLLCPCSLICGHIWCYLELVLVLLRNIGFQCFSFLSPIEDSKSMFPIFWTFETFHFIQSILHIWRTLNEEKSLAMLAIIRLTNLKNLVVKLAAKISPRGDNKIQKVARTF